MKIAHEAPLSIFKQVQGVTDYDYALVHLFEENDAYYQAFVDALLAGREVILDNSIFELGEAFSGQEYFDWIKALKPTYYIIPDVLEDKDGTIENFDWWMQIYGKEASKYSLSIAVVQGKTYEEICECYKYLIDKVDKIAISFDYSFFEQQFPNEPTKYHSWMKGRQELLVKMVEDNIIDEDKPHHLLGCGLPQEFELYENMPWIDSVDTSNPVVHGIKGIGYTWQGLENKESVKLYTMMNDDVTEHWDDIKYNIEIFRSLCNA